MVNLYEMIGLPSNCTGVDIRRSIAIHQQNGTLNEKQINAVKTYLLNPENREKYDLKLNESNNSDGNNHDQPQKL